MGRREVEADFPLWTPEAASAFREDFGEQPVLTRVGIEKGSVSFATNMRDKALGGIMTGLPTVASYGWNLNGLAGRIGTVDVSAQMGTPTASFGISEVDWTIVRKLETDALARLAEPRARVKEISVEKSNEGPGGPVLSWTVEVADPDGEVSSVVADVKGAILRIVLPERLRPKIDWLDPAALAGAISRLAPTFGEKASIASLSADDDGCRVTIDDPANGGRPATFAFSADGVTRATISFSLDSMGPRFTVADLAPLTQAKLAALEAEAFRKLAGNRKAYLESVHIGAHPFVPQAGGQAIEIRLRDIEKDSVRANYAWIVFDFTGRVLDSVTF